MQPERRRQIVLAVLVVVLAFALYRAWPRTAAPTTATSNPRSMARGGQATEVAAPDVKLEALEAERPQPEGSMRNLFRFGRPAAALAPTAPPVPVEPPQPTGPTTPRAPTIPPIPLKFVGTMKVGGRLMAVLSSDANGLQRDPVYGFEGDTILGQYRLVRVSAESIEMTYLDGRGRQTIRFSGS
jgi:hypothetical protein